MSEIIPGKYIVYEGHDGTGKTTQLKLLYEKLDAAGIDYIKFAEPAIDPKDGGVEDVLVADALRAIIKNKNLERLPMTDLFMFSAARHEKWFRKARPALEMGKWVVASRNYLSTVAYQGYGDGIDLDLIDSTTREATDARYMNPDVVVILNLEDEVERQRRIASRGPLENPDNFESKGNDFQSRVQNAYPQIAKRYNIPVISAAGDPQKISDEIWTLIEPKLG